MKKFIAVAIVLSLIFSFAACDSASNTEKKEAFNLSVSFANEPESIDPALNSTIDETVMLNHVFEGLIKWADNGEGKAVLAPGQARIWEKSPDGCVYTFHLRDNIKWSDGKDVTADDFVYSWKRAVNPETKAPYSYLLLCVENANEIINDEKPVEELGVKAVDAKTFEVRLIAPIPNFEEICTFPVTFPVRREIIETNKDQWTFSPDTYVSNGPYTMTKWMHNAYIDMKKNEYYYDLENSGPDSIRFALYDNDKLSLEAFEKGEIKFRMEVNNEIRFNLMQEVEKMLAAGNIVMPIYFGTVTHTIDKNLKGVFAADNGLFIFTKAYLDDTEEEK